ncbi:MAG: pyruvate dehydrogenase complex dihydrolipoamide acetyltransferase [Planctomycetota bacterium]|nr:MAG: pyruvate dehydrogenase complex dihydrolipoamide acetyltransferase [Planctomycetota bacterium]
MPIPITMPRLSDTMEQGTVVKWNVKVGDKVSSGDILADIETDKATMELQSFDDGIVAKLAAEEGQKISVGETILILAADGESVEEAAASGGASKPAAKSKSDGGSDTSASSPNATAVVEPPATTSNGHTTNGHTGTRVFASPLAKKIAEEHNLDLSGIAGSGPSGRIVRKDVESMISSGGATAAPAPSRQQAPAPMTVPAAGSVLESKTVSLSGMRETIAKRLVQSKTTIPHYQVTVSARLDKLMELREQLNEQLSEQGVKLSVNDFLVRACALAMHQHPFVNSSWSDNGPSIQLHGQVNIGVAVSLPQERGGGLVVATIRNADQIGLRQISAETKRLAKKARDKGLSVEEMSDSTFTISNLGMFGVDHFTAIINPPNAAILAVGRAIEKPFVEYDEDGEPELVIGHEMAMTMSSDHRIIDGAMAAEYLNSVKALLENPAALLV